MKPYLPLGLLAGCLLCLGGCEATDPLTRSDLWHPAGANESNIAAEVANPADLAYGRAPPPGSDGHLAAEAVLRLRQDRVKPLPDSLLSDIKVQSSGSNAAPAAGAPSVAGGE